MTSSLNCPPAAPTKVCRSNLSFTSDRLNCLDRRSLDTVSSLFVLPFIHGQGALTVLYPLGNGAGLRFALPQHRQMGIVNG